ncbi:hypothetical protein V5E97_21370 [Singulisphaera sp. Ch08]|uniref:Uncharacterized protein n=1 Tax=Singulisphaera sp. Ch08 TaxID=3120278 RepID=A0AAU7C6Z5_9BACT
MIQRLRVILPPASILLGILLFYLVFEGLILYYEWNVGGRIRLNVRPGVAIPLLAALAYGAYRVVAFHPFYRSHYRAWLERSPWTACKPLPLGPVALVWEDGVVLSLLALLSLVDPALDPFRLLAYFLVGYLVPLGMAFAPTGALVYAYIIAFGLGLVAQWMPADPRLALAVTILLAAIGQLGLRRSLKRFPWSLDWLTPIFSWVMSDKVAFEASMSGGCGWPFDKLGLKRLKPVPFELARRDAILIGPLVGWWLFAIGAGFSAPQNRIPFASLVACFGIGLLGLIRLLIYASGYLSPISLAGRLATFRWIIPGYDVIFVAPFCTLLLPLATYFTLALYGVTAEVSGPICLAQGLFITFNMGPSLKQWELTGQHRIVPTRTNELVKVG